jgi:hypothetical protein
VNRRSNYCAESGSDSRGAFLPLFFFNGTVYLPSADKEGSMVDEHEEIDPQPSLAPSQCPTAIVLDWRYVNGARVARIDRVFYRKAEFGGYFELADDPLCYYGKTPKLKVKMSWFGWAPDDGICQITPLSPVLFDGDYAGEVVNNIGLR